MTDEETKLRFGVINARLNASKDFGIGTDAWGFAYHEDVSFLLREIQNAKK